MSGSVRSNKAHERYFRFLNFGCPAPRIKGQFNFRGPHNVGPPHKLWIRSLSLLSFFFLSHYYALQHPYFVRKDYNRPTITARSRSYCQSNQIFTQFPPRLCESNITLYIFIVGFFWKFWKQFLPLLIFSVSYILKIKNSSEPFKFMSLLN